MHSFYRPIYNTYILPTHEYIYASILLTHEYIYIYIYIYMYIYIYVYMYICVFSVLRIFHIFRIANAFSIFPYCVFLCVLSSRLFACCRVAPAGGSHFQESVLKNIGIFDLRKHCLYEHCTKLWDCVQTMYEDCMKIVGWCSR